MKLIKRFMSLALSLCMIMALCFCSFADEGAKTMKLSITDPAEGHTYKVYQLLTGDVSALSNGEGTLANIEAGTHFKTVDGKTAKTVAEELSKLNDGALGNAAYGYLDTSKEPIVSFEKDGTTEKQVATGYYIIVDEKTDGTVEGKDFIYSRYMVAVVGDTAVKPKAEVPTLDKKIANTDDANKPLAGSDEKTNTAAIGDTVDFKITGQVPDYEGYTHYYYVINDTLSEGLTLVDDYEKDNAGKTGGFTVTVGDKTLTRDTDYFVYKDGQSFKVAFANIKEFAKEAAISVEYSATVNEKAEIGKNANTNTANLTYSNKPGESSQHDKDGKPGIPDTTVPTGETPDKVTKTFVTEINILKVDQDGMPLDGAEFTLTGENLNQVILRTNYTFEENTNGTYYKLKNGTYTTAAPILEDKIVEGKTVEANKDLYESVDTKYSRVTTVSTETTTASGSNAQKNVVATVNSNGFVTFTGLNAGKYTLSETETPTGYNTIKDIEFTISADYVEATDSTGDTVTWSSSDDDSVKYDKTSKTFTATIKNNKGTVLPSTGGIGTTIFYVIGSVMVLGAAVLLITKKRMSSEN